MKNFLHSLSPWHKALFFSLMFHLILFCLFFLPDDSAEQELQIVDTTKQSALEMDIAPSDTPDDASDSPLESAKPVPEAPSAPPPPQPPQESATVAFEKTPPKAPIRDLTIEQRVITPPRLKTIVNPRYPEKKLAELPAFKMKLIIMISETGQPTYVAIQTSSGIKELDEAAKAAIKQWQFYPAYDRTKNRPVPHPFLYELTYPLDDKDSPVEPSDATATAPASPAPTKP
ncbi:MAG: energy transducer TonB [Sporomusaceae bacterium]|nr:energy transducer TonB [Sporomusaceae bacterium]